MARERLDATEELAPEQTHATIRGLLDGKTPTELADELALPSPTPAIEIENALQDTFGPEAIAADPSGNFKATIVDEALREFVADAPDHLVATAAFKEFTRRETPLDGDEATTAAQNAIQRFREDGLLKDAGQGLWEATDSLLTEVMDTGTGTGDDDQATVDDFEPGAESGSDDEQETTSEEDEIEIPS